MSALRYLTLTTLKNGIRELKNRPSRLIAYLLFFALMVFLIFTGNMGNAAEGELRPMPELGLIILGFYGMIFVMDVMKGFSSGATFFTMADVNLLFCAPIRPKRILFYGLIRQAGMTLWVGFFIFFEYSLLHNTYGIDLGQLFLLFLGYGITYFCAEITAMTIYIFVNGNPTRKRWVRVVLYVLIALFVGAVVLPFAQSGFTDGLRALSVGANSTVVSCFPILGWTKSFVYMILTGNTEIGLFFLGLVLLFIAGVVLLIMKMQSDYYEDVLQATEVTYAQKQAAKEGKIQEANFSLNGGKVKRGQTGLRRGMGAGVFYSKHMLENRRAGIFFFDKMSLLFLIIGGVMAFFMKDLGIIGIFSMFTYFQLFTSATGRWLRELDIHYVYLIPERPYSKLIRLCSENICKVAVDAVVTMLLIGFIVGASPLEIVAAILARFGFGILFMAGNILSQRVLGSVASKGLLMFLYFIVMILLCLPGMIGGVLLGAMSAALFSLSAAWQVFIGMLTTLIFNLLISTLLLFLCRNLLDTIELNKK